MAHVTHDRGEIIAFIGRLSGSPALAADGTPTVVTGHDAGGAKRVGWAAFFHEMDQRQLAMRQDEDGAWSWVPRHGAHGDAPPAAPPADAAH